MRTRKNAERVKLVGPFTDIRSGLNTLRQRAGFTSWEAVHDALLGKGPNVSAQLLRRWANGGAIPSLTALQNLDGPIEQLLTERQPDPAPAAKTKKEHDRDG